jgi:hypothetical protein
MPVPTFVGAYATTFNTATSPKSTSAFDVALGDVLVMPLADESFATGENYTWGNSGTALTWTEQTAATAVNGSDVFTQIATAVPPGSQTGITASLTRVTGAGSGWFGGVLARFSNATLVGAASARSTAPDTTSPYQLAITTLLDNSAIVYAVVDFSAIDFSTRVHTTVNGYTPSVGNGLELGYFRDSAHYATCWAYIPDAGAAGAKTVGMTGPASGDVLLVAAEIGGVGGAAALPPILVLPPRR